MPSFAFHPINRISRSISSPNPSVAHPQSKVVSLVTIPRPRPSHPLDPDHPSPLALAAPLSRSQRREQPNMPRLNPLNLISAITSATTSSNHSQQSKPASPVSSLSASSSPDSLPVPPSYPRSSSYGPTRTHRPSDNMHSKEISQRAVTDLPPVSPMSSMYDPYSPEVSADGSGPSDDDSGTSQTLSSSSDSDSLDGNLFLRPRSTGESRVNTVDVPPATTNSHPHSRLSDRDLGPPVAFRRALFENSSSPAPAPFRPAHPRRSRESAFAGIAARGKVVDAFVANRHVPELTRNDESADLPHLLPRVMSGNSLEIPRGKAEHLPVPRPVTPCQVPRPETPSRLPRPRVFIKPSPSRQSIIDPVAVTHHSESRPGESDFITREIPRPVTPSPFFVGKYEPGPTIENISPLQEPEFYFSDEESVEDDISEYRLDQCPPATPTPGDMLSYKVRRAVSALRSISFQSHNPDEIETAWGQANAVGLQREKILDSSASNRWRRARGRISSKNGVQEYECRSEADAHSISSYASSVSAQRDRACASRDQIRGIIGVPIRGDHGSRQKRSLWTGGRRERQQAPRTRAAELLIANHGILAASTDVYDLNNALTPVPSAEATEISERARNNARRCSVDKYVEFIHASAQRETRSKNQYRNLPSRMLNRWFRRRWN